MDIRIFKNERFGEVRVAELNGAPMFCLSDVCKALEISNSRDLRSRLRERGVVLSDTLTNGDVRIYIKTLVLQRGLDGIRQLLSKKCNKR